MPKTVRMISGQITCHECKNIFVVESIKEPEPKEWNMMTICPFCGTNFPYAVGFFPVDTFTIPVTDGTEKSPRKNSAKK